MLDLPARQQRRADRAGLRAQRAGTTGGTDDAQRRTSSAPAPRGPGRAAGHPRRRLRRRSRPAPGRRPPPGWPGRPRASPHLRERLPGDRVTRLGPAAVTGGRRRSGSRRDAEAAFERAAAAVLLPAAHAARTRSAARRAPPACGRTPRPSRRRRASTRPSSTTPPPMPVPMLTSRNELGALRPAPIRELGTRPRSARRCPARPGRPTARRAGPRTGSSRHGRWVRSAPVSPAARPARPPRPRPRSSGRPSATASTAAGQGVLELRDGCHLAPVSSRRAVRRTSPSSDTSTASTLVPPTSTPTYTRLP